MLGFLRNCTYRTEVLVIGGGPAGLAAALGCVARRRDFLVIESGKRVRQRDHSDQGSLAIGVGGSGLYSDGKFSFYPSATALWQLGERKALQESWLWFSGAVAPFGLTPPALPDLRGGPVPGSDRPFGDDRIGRKDYPSVYLAYDSRRRLIEALEAGCGTHLLTGVELRGGHYDADNHLFRCNVRVEGLSALDRIEARAVVYAGGRLGPLGWSALFPQLARVFKRMEVGVRLEQSSRDFFLQLDPALDPKLILRSPDDRYSWRTFCCCRDGEIVTTETQGVLSVSGRGDCPPTGRSNVGFNLRVRDARLTESLWPTGRWLTGDDRRPAYQLLTDFLDTYR